MKNLSRLLSKPLPRKMTQKICFEERNGCRKGLHIAIHCHCHFPIYTPVLHVCTLVQLPQIIVCFFFQRELRKQKNHLKRKNPFSISCQLPTSNIALSSSSCSSMIYNEGLLRSLLAPRQENDETLFFLKTIFFYSPKNRPP